MDGLLHRVLNAVLKARYVDPKINTRLEYLRLSERHLTGFHASNKWNLRAHSDY
jgi:hypothetical protein